MRRILEANPVFPRSMVKEPVYRASHRQGLQSRSDGAFYFADEPKTSSFGKFVIKAWIDIQNPFLLLRGQIEDVVAMMPYDHVEKMAMEDEDFDPDFDEPQDWLIDQMDEGTWQLHQEPVAQGIIKQLGYDGVISSDSFGGYTEYVVFSEDQISIIEEVEM